MHQRFAQVITCLLLLTQGLSGVLGYGLHMGQSEPCCSAGFACDRRAESRTHSHSGSHDCPFDHDTRPAESRRAPVASVAHGNHLPVGTTHDECPVCRHLSLLRHVVAATPVVVAELPLVERLVPVHSGIVLSGTHYRICPRGPPATA